jgi:hypothetical protein
MLKKKDMGYKSCWRRRKAGSGDAGSAEDE